MTNTNEVLLFLAVATTRAQIRRGVARTLAIAEAARRFQAPAEKIKKYVEWAQVGVELAREAKREAAP